MKLGPQCPANRTQLKANIKITEMIFNQTRPSVQISPTGRLDTFTPWKSDYHKTPRAHNWLELQRRTDIVVADLSKCIECNPDYYVAVAGYNDRNVIDSMYLMYEPDIPSCPIPMVDPATLGKDEPENSI